MSDLIRQVTLLDYNSIGSRFESCWFFVDLSSDCDRIRQVKYLEGGGGGEEGGVQQNNVDYFNVSVN